jgi:hypothetical protein
MSVPESLTTPHMEDIPQNILDLGYEVCDIIPMSGDQLISELQAKVAFHKRELAIWEAALDSALHSGNKKERARTTKNAATQTHPKVIAPSPYIVGLVRSRQQVGGITSTEIRSQAAKDQLSFAVDKGFPYKQLNRLKRTGIVKREDGRYFLAK